MFICYRELVEIRGCSTVCSILKRPRFQSLCTTSPAERSATVVELDRPGMCTVNSDVSSCMVRKILLVDCSFTIKTTSSRPTKKSFNREFG